MSHLLEMTSWKVQLESLSIDRTPEDSLGLRLDKSPAQFSFHKLGKHIATELKLSYWITLKKAPIHLHPSLCLLRVSPQICLNVGITEQTWKIISVSKFITL